MIFLRDSAFGRSKSAYQYSVKAIRGVIAGALSACSLFGRRGGVDFAGASEKEARSDFEVVVPKTLGVFCVVRRWMDLARMDGECDGKSDFLDNMACVSE